MLIQLRVEKSEAEGDGSAVTTCEADDLDIFHFMKQKRAIEGGHSVAAEWAFAATAVFARLIPPCGLAPP